MQSKANPEHGAEPEHAAEYGFDAAFYGALYRDLSEKGDAALLEHYLQFGQHEGRFKNAASALQTLEAETGPLPADFDEAEYIDLYQDVRQRFGFPGGGAFHFLEYGRAEGRPHKRRKFSYDEHLLNLMTNRIHDMPEVVLDPAAPARVNVLVPAFEFKSMSAGFFGVFQVARFIASQGFRVRLVMFDNFYWNEAEFRVKLLGYPGMERLFDEIEVEYIGARERPLTVSRNDSCVATVWYSAYFADKIMRTSGGGRFLYLIQDYEAAFFPGGSLSSFADASYDLEFDALFSTETLRSHFLKQQIGAFGSSQPPRSISFNNACARTLAPLDEFLSSKGPKKRLALYSRPEVNRNMFELAALSLCQAVREGVFDPEAWEFFGVGLGDVTIELAEGVHLTQLPRMDLKTYQEVIASFDVGLCLMASPHPSLLPFDLAGSGAVVVTNTYGPKDQAFFDAICSNIIARPPAVASIVRGLSEAVARTDDLQARHVEASRMRYPATWEETFGPEHGAFVREVFADVC